jgi:hypothetical protein
MAEQTSKPIQCSASDPGGLLQEACQALQGITRISVHVSRGPKRTSYTLRFSVRSKP